MNFINYILTVLLSLQPSYGDKETWEQRSDRMQIIATAIDDASSRATCEDRYATSDCKKLWIKDKKSLAMLLVMKGYFESRFAKNVHEGKCYDYECDAYKSTDGHVRHRARSPWQIQQTGMVTADEYSKMNSSSLDSTTMSAIVATRYLANGMKHCKTIRGTIAIYGGATDCKWEGAAGREAFFHSLMKKSDNDLKVDVERRKKDLEERLKQK